MKLQFKPFPELKGNRIILRKLRLDDTTGIYLYQSDKDNFPHVDMPIYRSKDEAKNYIEKMNMGVENEKWLIWAITVHDQIMGTISLWNLDEEQQSAELGYGLFPGYRKKGYMTETIELVEVFARKMGIQKLIAYTSLENSVSINLLKRNAYLFQKSLIEDGFYSKKPIEMVVYEKVIK